MPAQVTARVAALPTSALESLRQEMSWDTIGRIIWSDRWLADEGARLSDDLYELIGDPANAPVKSRLVALRRAVFGGRRLPPRAWSAEVRASLPKDLVERVERWTARHATRSELLVSLPDIHAKEDAQNLQNLWHTLHSPAFRHGLVQGSPLLYNELERWLAGPPEAGPGRQAHLRLVKYLARVVAKTSPYSTFTISGWVRLSEETVEPHRFTGSFVWTSVVELNIWLVASMARAAAKRPEILRRQEVRPNPSLLAEDDTLRFLSPALGHPVVAVRRGPALDECLRKVAQTPGLSVEDVAAYLRGIDSTLTEAETVQFVSRLVEVGAICAVMPFDDQDDDHLAGLARTLATDSGTGPLAEEVLALRDGLRRYPALTDPGDRRALRQEIYGQVEHLVAPGRLEIREPLPRKNLFHENAVFTRPVIECGERSWQPVFGDLADLRGLLGRFDPMLPARQALTQIFVAEYGTGGSAPWLDFFRLTNRLVAGGAEASIAGVDGRTLGLLRTGPMGNSPEIWQQLPFVREQAALRSRGTEFLLSRPPGPDGAVRVSAQQLVEVLGDDGTPKLRDSLTCYVQLVDGPEEGQGPPRVALNVVTGGYGRGTGRLVRLLRQAGAGDEAVGFSPAGHGPDGEVVADSAGLFGSNLNLRARCCQYELDYPFVTSAREQELRIPLQDLRVTHDPEADLLRLSSATTGMRIQPAHLGIMAELWLPPPMRDLVGLFGPPGTLMHASLPLFVPRDTDPRAGGIWVLPRLEVGRVTLSRRCWVFPAREMPPRRKGDSETGFWLRFAAWIADHELPEKFFARVLDASEATFRPEMKSRKPIYVDTSIWHLVALLERAITNGGDLVVLTEARPGLPEAPRYGREQHVTEFMLELPGE